MPGGLEEIAKEAGVAPSTVSRALAGKRGVSETKRRAIVEIATRCDFLPNPSASGLRTGRGSGLVVVTGPRPTGITALRNHVLFACGKAVFGHTRVLVKSEGEPLDVAIRQALSQRAAAIVISSLSGQLDHQTIALLTQRTVPLATIDADVNFGDRFVIDRATGTYQCARLLILSGCRSVVVFSRARLDKPDARLQGIVAGYTSLNRELSADDVIHYESPDFAGGYHTMRDLIGRRPIDGAFCYSDDIAMGALRALAEAGVRVPDDIRVVGFDNVAASEYGFVPLTTVAQPLDKIARAAVDACKARLDDVTAEPLTRTFPTHLIVRRSAPIDEHRIREQIFEQAPPSE